MSSHVSIIHVFFFVINIIMSFSCTYHSINNWWRKKEREKKKDFSWGIWHYSGVYPITGVVNYDKNGLHFYAHRPCVMHCAICAAPEVILIIRKLPSPLRYEGKLEYLLVGRLTRPVFFSLRLPNSPLFPIWKISPKLQIASSSAWNSKLELEKLAQDISLSVRA